MRKLFQHADHAMAEDKKLHFLMWGVKRELFVRLIRYPPKTFDEFLTEAMTIEKVLEMRTRQYDRRSSTVNYAGSPCPQYERPARDYPTDRAEGATEPIAFVVALSGLDCQHCPQGSSAIALSFRSSAVSAASDELRSCKPMLRSPFTATSRGRTITVSLPATAATDAILPTCQPAQRSEENRGVA
ncbi:uncharacterized protein LOC142813835 [Rhipicephalus microplus]|uniref:uncharacterized protein LOC142813835 n=1 Tax=Rhipicephalus microplus TaxID=6941 RepID=UPI003F6A911D